MLGQLGRLTFYYYIDWNIQKMQKFDLKSSYLVEIVSACQERTFAEEIDILLKRGNDIHWLLEALKTHQKKGISIDQKLLKSRKKQYGTNEKYVKEPPGFCTLFLEALNDFTLKILIFASILSIGIEVGTADDQHRSTAWIEGFAVMMAVMISASVTAINDYQKERQFLKLNSVADQRKKVTLKRNGELIELHQDLVLVGDIVHIQEGMQIPADAILLESNEITTDESAMTGETDPVQKNTLNNCIKKKIQLEQNGEKNIAGKHEVPSPILMSGTRVLTGEGKMMILVVGQISCIGKIRALLSQDQQIQTPLQEKLEKIAGDIGKLGLFSAVLILSILLIRFGIQKIISKTWETSVDLPELLNFFILAITVIVVAIPEGLPLSVTLSLAVSMRRMLDDSNLVRKMQACQTMGGANNICSDKTGTLTMNKMTLTEIWNGHHIEIPTHDATLSLLDITKDMQFLELFTIGTCVNSTANLLPEEKGSSTEIAILKYFKKTGINYQTYREKYEPMQKYPFSSSRKRMSIVCKLSSSTNAIFVKGASEMVLSTCNQWYNVQDKRVELISQSIRAKMNVAINKMAENSLRTLCVAYKKISNQTDLEQKDQKGIFQVQKSQLVLLAILGVRDIPRKEVPEAIKLCHQAGIKVRMVTGDNLITAKAIAKDVGIIQDENEAIVMEGIQFNQLIGGVICKKCRTVTCDCARDAQQAKQLGKDLRVDTIQNGQEFDKIMDKLLVLARSRPEDKYALVTGLKERGEVVAVTGDGTNDAPALKKADVGFAMGIAGTEVARESAAIILLDDNFNSIVKAVMWGRNIYDSIRKFIQFQLTVNIVAVFITLIGAAIIKQQILKPIQMLWINLIMDTLASLALATQPPTEELLQRKPYSRKEYIISRTMLKHIIGQAIYQLTIMILLVFVSDMFIPEYPGSLDATTFKDHPDYKFDTDDTVKSGRLIHFDNQPDYITIFDATGVYSRHFTFIFNTFVMMQVFNFLNCRKIHDQKNIFEGITRNKLFIIIVFGILVLQVIIVTFGGRAFAVFSGYGLHYMQWLYSILIGSTCLLVNLLLKFVWKFKPEEDIILLKEQKEKDDHQEVNAQKMEEFHQNNETDLGFKKSSIIQLKTIEIQSCQMQKQHKAKTKNKFEG